MKENSSYTPTYTLEWLRGEAPHKKYIYFWGHRSSKDGKIIKSCFNQWWKSGFTEDDISFTSMEQYMMMHKARLFGDKEVEHKIIMESNPKIIKELGRQVKNFDEEIWNSNKYQIVVKGNYLKFTQDISLMSFILTTGEAILVEASPYDKVWGIGMAQDDKDISCVDKWRGENLLGFALMEVRDMIRNENKQ